MMEREELGKRGIRIMGAGGSVRDKAQSIGSHGWLLDYDYYFSADVFAIVVLRLFNPDAHLKRKECEMYMISGRRAR